MNDLKLKKVTDLIERAKSSKEIARKFLAIGEDARASRWIAYAKADLAEAKQLASELIR